MTMMATLETMAVKAAVAVDRLIDSTGSEGEYRRLVALAAEGQKVEIEPELLEATGRFPADFDADVDRRRQREAAAREVAAADKELSRLAEIATPRPTASTPLDSFETLGEMAMALELFRRPNTTSKLENEQRQAVWDQERRRATGLNCLRFTSDKSIDALDAIQRERIEQARQRTDQRHDAWARRQALGRELAKPDKGVDPKVERERRSELEREYRRVGKVAATAEAVALADEQDRGEVQKAEVEIERVDKQRLVPERMTWSSSRG